MIVPIDVKCKVCKKIFCCKKCRINHQNNKHMASENHVIKYNNIGDICPICKNDPLLMHFNIPRAIIDHISTDHLPLHCKKCFKIYNTEQDLLQFSHCSPAEAACFLQKLDSEKNINVEDKAKNPSNKILNSLVTVSTQTSPVIQDINIKTSTTMNSETISKCLLKPRNSEALITDISASKNLSSVDGSHKQFLRSSGRKLTRSTSTPMQALIPQIRENAFDSSSCHVSSIHSSSESDISPPIVGVRNSLSSQSVKCDRKMITKFRNKMPVTATPLRQVMSKSIQKAMAERGLTNYKNLPLNPKKISYSNESIVSINSPLDLRTSPVLRRTENESPPNHIISKNIPIKLNTKMKILTSTRKSIAENLIITSENVSRTLDTVYETCKSIESTTTYEANDSKDEKTNIENFTPKIVGGFSKKIISFESPDIVQTTETDIYNDEVFYTPPLRNYNCSIESSINKNSDFNRPTSNKRHIINTLKTVEENQNFTTEGKLWSLLNKVIQLTSFGNNGKNKTCTSLIRRCASFAGMGNFSSEDKLSNNCKRKRTKTVENSLTLKAEYENIEMTPSKRFRRIQGRKPIERLRKAS